MSEEVKEALSRIEACKMPNCWSGEVCSDAKVLAAELRRLLAAVEAKDRSILQTEAVLKRMDCDCAGEYDREGAEPTCYRCQAMKLLRSPSAIRREG